MTGTRENSRHGHVFRPGPLRAQQAWWLEGHVLHWKRGQKTGHIPLGEIASMRLHLPAGGAAATAQCELTEVSGRRHRITDRYWFRWTPEERHRFGRHERHEATFRGLTFTLARRLAQARPQAQILAGPGRGEWIATCIVAALAIAILTGGAGLMTAAGRVSLPALAFMAVCALYLPVLWPVVRSGGPRPLDPATLHRIHPAPGSVDR